MKKVPVWLLVAGAFMLVLFIAQRYVASNHKFEVVYSQGTTIPGYESSPDAARVYASPAIKWSEVPFAWKIMGWFFFFMIAAAAYYVQQKAFSNGKAVGAILAPVLLCAVCWFAGYSASLDRGSLVTSVDNLKTAYGVPDKTIDYIKTHSGTKNIKDESGKLTAYFKGQ